MEPYKIILSNDKTPGLLSEVINIKSDSKSFLGLKRIPKGNYKIKANIIDSGKLILGRQDKEEFFQFIYKGVQGNPIDIEFDNNTETIMLLYNPAQVKDCLPDTFKENNVSPTSVKVEILLYKKNSNMNFFKKIFSKKKSTEVIEELLQETTIQIPIEVECPDSEIQARIEFAKELPCNQGCIDVLFDGRSINLGTLVLSNKVNKGCAYPIQSATLAISSSSPYIAPRFDLKIDEVQQAIPNVSLNALAASCDTDNKGALIITNLDPQNELRIPIVMDLTNCQNPPEDTEVGLCLSGNQRSNNKQSDVHVSMGSFKISKNNQKHSLSVVVDDGFDRKNIVNRERYDWGTKNVRYQNDGNENVETLTLSILNTANVYNDIIPNAGIKIRNLKQKIETKGFIDKGGQSVINTNFLFNSNPDVGNREFIIGPNSNNSGVDLSLQINLDRIRDYIGLNNEKERKLSVDLTCSFEYQVDEQGLYNGAYERFEVHFVWEILLQNPLWYSVDFGTSAIVVARGTVGSLELINLNENRDKMLREALGSRYKELVDPSRAESGELITSSISLWKDDSKPYNITRAHRDIANYPIFLAPPQRSTDQIKLPRLKTLVGYSRIPNVLEPGQSFSYTHNVLRKGNKDTIVKAKMWENADPLSNVNTIIEEVYKLLFNHYICYPKRSDDGLKDIHKIAMSVPNTFTPIHHALIKDVVHKICPELPKKNISIVSESDAVACYYIQNRFEMYNKLNVTVPKEEHVLVFDMGAGTLDLTYFKILGNANITIEGRLGICKAGDYIDYKLAEIYTQIKCKKLKKLGKEFGEYEKLLSCSKDELISKGISVKKLNGLKDIVKYNIKPNLGNDEHCIEEIVENETIRISISEIKGETYNKLIKECTVNVLEKFVNIQRTSNLRIDTLILSGRSTGLYDIRQKVLDFVNLNNTNEEYYVANLSSLSMIKVSKNKNAVTTETQQPDDLKNLKTIVSKGAVYYADWMQSPGQFTISQEGIYAEYGVLLKTRQGGSWVYNSLINRNSCRNDNCYEGRCNISTAAYSEVIFVQSYEPDTLEAWKNKNRDMISVIRQEDVINNANQIALRITISQDMSIDCSVQNMGRQNSVPRDDFSNPNLRKSLWPVVF